MSAIIKPGSLCIDNEVQPLPKEYIGLTKREALHRMKIPQYVRVLIDGKEPTAEVFDEIVIAETTIEVTWPWWASDFL